MKKTMEAFKRAMFHEFEILLKDISNSAHDILEADCNEDLFGISRQINNSDDFNQVFKFTKDAATNAYATINFDFAYCKVDYFFNEPSNNYTKKQKAYIFHIFNEIEALVSQFNRN